MRVFKPGDIIEYCDDKFEVLENHGYKGTVKELGKNPVVISSFHWFYCGTGCKLVKAVDA